MVAPSGRVRLALDAMGGDHGPAEVVPGGIRWAKENPHDELILVGDEPLLLELAGGTLPANTRIVHGPDVIGMDEHPAQALRERKGASILVATNLVREGLADAVVTGGTSGIGYAASTAFADAGASVTVTGTRSSAADYDTELSRFTYKQLEMRDGEAIDALAASLGTLDVLINNAGASFPDGLDEWSPEGFHASIAMNVEGAQRLSVRSREALAKSSMPGGASVVNVISMMTSRPCLPPSRASIGSLRTSGSRAAIALSAT